MAVFGQIGTPNRRRPRADKAEIYEPPAVYPIPCTAAGLSCDTVLETARRAGLTNVTSPADFESERCASSSLRRAELASIAHVRARLQRHVCAVSRDQLSRTRSKSM